MSLGPVRGLWLLQLFPLAYFLFCFVLACFFFVCLFYFWILFWEELGRAKGWSEGTGRLVRSGCTMWNPQRINKKVLKIEDMELFYLKQYTMWHVWGNTASAEPVPTLPWTDSWGCSVGHAIWVKFVCHSGGSQWHTLTLCWHISWGPFLTLWHLLFNSIQ